MLSIKIIFVSIIFFMLPLSLADAHIEYTEELRANDAQIVETCEAAESGVSIQDKAICFKADITEDTVEATIAALHANPNHKLVLQSSGGGTDSAIKLAEVIDKLETRVLIINFCNSSCANYLAPAAFAIVVWDGATILMHGSLPREKSVYINSQIQIAAKRGEIDLENISVSRLLSHPVFQNARNSFASFIDTKVREESAIFTKISPSETYLHRYWEVLRNVETYANDKCQPQGGFNVIVGPKMAKEFSFLNVDYFWWPSDEEVIKGSNLTRYGTTLVMDMNLMPSYVPGHGFIEQGDCLKDIYKQTSE